jgi:site-specific DNA recombinase
MRNCKHPYLLRGLIVCGACGLRYHGIYYRDNDGDNSHVTHYYTCGGKTAYRGPLQGKCTNPNVRADWLEDLVWSQIVGFVQNPKEALERLREEMAAAEEPLEDLAARRHDLETALTQKDVERQRIMSLYRRGVVRMSDVEVQLAEVEREESALRSELEALSDFERGVEDTQARFETAEALLASLRDSVADGVTWEAKRDIVTQLVKEVRIEPGPSGRWHKEPTKATVTYRFT